MMLFLVPACDVIILAIGRLFCKPIQQVKMYFHDEVTPGTRVFRRVNGNQYDVSKLSLKAKSELEC